MTQKPQAKQHPLNMLSIIYILLLAGLVIFGLLPSLSLLIISLMNVLSYWLYVQDKQAAQQGERRVAENNLHILAFLGG